MKWDTIWQILRYLLIAGGGYLTARGTLTNSDLESIVGAIGAIGTVLWGLYVKAGTSAVPDAVAERRDVPVVSGATGAVKK